MAKQTSKEKERAQWRSKFKQNILSLASTDVRKLTEIEEKEDHYLRKYYYFLKYVEDEMLNGFYSKEIIHDDWIQFWGNQDSGLSDFAVGAERIVYALLNGKGIGTPNSCPVGSDLMFELPDAFIHIDLKSVSTDNIGDYQDSIFIGSNQNSYEYSFKTQQGRVEDYKPNLPQYYTVKRKNEKEVSKICLSYFVTILYDNENLDTICIALLCMPNGRLAEIYQEAPLKAGKNPGKARFNFQNVRYFETLSQNGIKKPRVKIIYLNTPRIKSSSYSDKLSYIEELYNSPENA